jgi:Fic family protein
MPVLSLLSKADRHLGRLDMYSEYVNINLFIQMHIAKEATQSSKIEGTQTRIEDAFMNKADITIEKSDDWEEVQNYISAMNEAVNMLHTLPVQETDYFNNRNHYANQQNTSNGLQFDS